MLNNVYVLREKEVVPLRSIKSSFRLLTLRLFKICKVINGLKIETFEAGILLLVRLWGERGTERKIERAREIETEPEAEKGGQRNR